jgi:CBS domain-containing protein
MTIETILRQKGTDVVTIEPEASIRRAANRLRVKNIGALVVISGKVVLGLISEREIVHAFSRHGETAASMPQGLASIPTPVSGSAALSPQVSPFHNGQAAQARPR